MEKEGERKKVEANNFAVSFSALRKDVVNVLDFMEMLKNEEDQNAVDMADEIERLKFSLAFVCTYVQLSYSDLEQFEDAMTAQREEVEDLLRSILDDVDKNVRRKYNMHHVLPSLMENIDEQLDNCSKSSSTKNRGLIVVNSPNKIVESKSPSADKIIVGFEEETHGIIRKLIDGHKDLDVISITGMPGLGKTTLAYKVYNDESVSSRFDICAWCTVGQEYDEKKLLGKIYNQITGSDLKFSKDIDVADMLWKQLFGKRYLIVLDDVWDATTWDALTRPFPDVQKGSRIILTTREMEVALHGKRNTNPLKLRLLRPEESWELLEKRAFGRESCPDELLDVGIEIVQNCKGLPLVADLIAGVITGSEKKKTVWLEVRDNLNSFIFNREVEVMKVIELSYGHLPVHLRPCFLYLASCSKDSAMERDVVKMLWCAEGLVERTESVEEEMEVYLDNLISSSLVISFNEIGEDPTYQLHDLVHDFCLIKAREEQLFDWISSSAPSSSSDLMPRIVTIKYDKEHFGLNNFVLFSSKKKSHSGKHLYSLCIHGDKLDDHLSNICHLRDLRLLRVLQLDESFIRVKDSLLNEICKLNHLRYLNIWAEVKSLPSSLSNLRNLETLSVHNRGSTLVLLPRIRDLAKLRVLFMSSCSFFDTDELILIAEHTKLENLRIFGKLVLSYSKNAEDIFKRFPNLQVLEFDLKESWDYSTEKYWFPKLDFLSELEDLNVKFESSNSNDSGPSVAANWQWDFHFPSSLKILWLRDFPLTSDSLSTIARLPNLEELTLVDSIIQGEEWNMREEDTFENLKCLKLVEVTLAKWEVGEESFPVLEKLDLRECHKL